METFETFEALYNKAIFYGEIEPAEGNHSKVVKDALNSINQTFYEREFGIWLQNKKEFNPEKGSIQPFLTEENWIEFFREHTKQAEAAHADYLNKQADRKRRIDSEEVPKMPQVPLSKQKQMQKGNSGLNQAEFALWCFYEYEVSNDGAKWKITTDPVRFADEEGWNSPNSGKGLKDWYSAIQKPEIRIGQADNSDRVLSNIEIRIKNVIPLLTKEARRKAEKELELVQNLIKEQSI